MATPATLSDLHELRARLHDLSVVAQRTRGRQRVLVSSLPGPSTWAGPAAVAYTSHRLALRAAALGALADALDGVAGHLGGVLHVLPPPVSAGLGASSSPSAIAQAQRLLSAAGASPGSVDGIWGTSSVAAVVRIQTRAGLVADGVVHQATALAISAAAVGGAVAIGGAPGMPHGLTPLAGSHPVVVVAATPDPAVTTDPAQVADPAGGDPIDDPTADQGDGDGESEGADPVPNETGVSDLLHRLSPAPAPVLVP